MGANPAARFQKLVESLPRRVEAVISNALMPMVSFMGITFACQNTFGHMVNPTTIGWTFGTDIHG